MNEILAKLKAASPYLYDETFDANYYQATADELKDATVIDIGANIGYFAFFASVNGAKKIYAFESNLDNFLKLLRNCQDFNNVVPVNLAVSKPGLKQANVINTEVWSQVVENSQGSPVNCISLEELLDIIQDENLVLKIDCEGSEYDIILPAAHLLRKFKYIYSEIHNEMHPNPAYNVDMLEQFIRDTGFQSSRYPISFGLWCEDGSFVPNSIQNAITKFIRND
jgi:FkbM family methyltransferase